jgi:uncharacterized protein (TIGR03435 family)
MKTKVIYTAVTIWFCMASLFVSLSLNAAENGGPKVGDKPPVLQATDLLQAPPGTILDAESIRGKVVILEFWATWCGPCVAAIPHLNELAEEFKGKPVQFIAITAEDKETVTKFLAKRSIKTWIALDTDQAMNRAYAVEAIPHTVVLDKDGRIAAITYPTMLTAKVIEDLLAGKQIYLPEPTSEKAPENENQARPLFQTLIRPSSYTNTVGFHYGKGNMEADGFTLQGALPLIFNISSDRIVAHAPLPKGLYDFVVTQPWPPKADEGANTLLQEAVKSAFGLMVDKQTNQMDAFILRVKESNPPDLTASATKGMHLSTSLASGVASVKGVGVSITAMASFLEDRLETPVVDETGLTNHYDISLEWKQESWGKPNIAGLKQAVRDQLGLERV